MIFFLDKNHRTRLVDFDKSKIPLVNVRSNIEGFINRNTYYKLVDLALSKDYKLEDELYIKSFSINHVIGKIA